MEAGILPLKLLEFKDLHAQAMRSFEYVSLYICVNCNGASRGLQNQNAYKKTSFCSCPIESGIGPERLQPTRILAYKIMRTQIYEDFNHKRLQ